MCAQNNGNSFNIWFEVAEKVMAEKVEYIIKTKIGQSFDFVYIEENELSFENFVENGKYVSLMNNPDFFLPICMLMDGLFHIFTCSNQSVQNQRRWQF